MSARAVVLISGTRKRTHQVPLGTDLQDFYLIDGTRWTVVAVLTTEDVPLTASVPA